MIALCCRCDTVSVVISAGDEPARPAEGLPAPNSPANAVRNPAQVSFWLLEPVADAAMTYFGVRERHYEVFRRALHATLQRFAAPRWNETAKQAPSRLIHYDLNPKAGQGL
jgi:hypothetical protein